MILGDSWNYMSPILVSSSAKRIATQNTNVSNWKINWEKRFYFKRLFCDIIHPSKGLSFQSKLLKHKNKVWKLFRIKNDDNDLVPVSLYLTVKIFQTCFIVDFEQANLFRVHLEKIALLKTRSSIMRYFVLYKNLLSNSIGTYTFTTVQVNQ